MKKIIALCLTAAILLCGCKPAEIPGYSGAPEFPDLSNAGSNRPIKIPEDTARYPSSSSVEPSGGSSGSQSEIKIPDIPVEKPSASHDLRHITLPLTNDHTNRRVLTIDGEHLTIEVKNGDWMTNSVNIGSTEFMREDLGNNSLLFTLDGTGMRKGYLNLELYSDDWGSSYRIKHDKEGFSFPDVMDVAANNANIAASPKALTYEQTLKYITKDGKPDNAAAVLEKIKTLSNKICRGLRSDYDKLRAISRWVSENIYYDHPAYKNGIPAACLSLEYMLENSSSVCGGYAAMTSALCEAQGITCLHINGDAINQVNCYAESDNGVHHEWNYAVIGSKGVWVDSGWNSHSNLYSNGKYTQADIAYTYFDIGSEVFALDHKARSAILRNYFPE